MQVRTESGTFGRIWKTAAAKTYMPFAEEMKAIASIADKHPQPQRFLDCVAKVAKELAIADGVNLID
ncbi:MAG: hypothetical protein KME60_03540 [Cyanomargarita calcarea GSE-NOS-MK-12-04C]|jgi:hypothetical protein|uniref:Uncharacterized protein n=1 Tax=Cyanomargarita calcarea GSE-NOS-MK-12-04C TaxID=2839659 RepID=A0A951QII6_9CYAN|nr:hypothetical protein [Cyanomargarita calcarea GSE-NOS-MK-12-04C]